jgi:Flp pilus assembly protein TadD
MEKLWAGRPDAWRSKVMAASSRGGAARLVIPCVLVPLIAAAAAGCATRGAGDTTGAVSAPAPGEGDWRREVEVAGELYRTRPYDADAAIRYAQALRAIGQRAQAAAVLEQTSLRDPKNPVLLGAFGRALADAGKYGQALEVLNRAHSPDQPDWRILSVQGAVLDQMGRHEEARRYYASALRLAPDEPSVLSNLGLSYALSKDLKQAEATLRRAGADGRIDPRVRQNLALVVGLQGRFAEAETIARADLPSEEAAANVAYLRQMLAHPKGIAKLPNPGAS